MRCIDKIVKQIYTLIVRIVDRNRVESIKKAVSSVSGFGEAELRISRDHTVTPWASLGMHLISKEGETLANAGSHYGRKPAAVNAINRKIKSNPERFKPHLDKILERIESCG